MTVSMGERRLQWCDPKNKYNNKGGDEGTVKEKPRKAKEGVVRYGQSGYKEMGISQKMTGLNSMS